MIKKIIFFSIVILLSGCLVSKELKQMKLVVASGKGDLKAVKQLVENEGVDVNSLNGRLGPALVMASYQGHKDVVVFLLENGADVNIRDEKGTTPLMNAVLGGKTDVVKILLEKNADAELPILPLVKDKNGNPINAITFARAKENKEIEDLLQNHIKSKTN